jgi:glycerophosphoryl diester phosphodiesterase
MFDLIRIASVRIACAVSVAALVLSACGAVTGTPVSTSATALPQIVAHRGGTGDAPENTLEAIRMSLAQHVDAIWLTVQLSKDGVPVLYRPADLDALTNASGPVSAFTADELSRVNAGWTFRVKNAEGSDDFPYRRTPATIPTLSEALREIPSTVPVILDMKALPAEPQTQAVARVLAEAGAWSRVILYSTDASYQQSFAAYPQATLFETRDATRTRLLKVALSEGCIDPPGEHAWTAFEMHRPLTVTEKFTLGEASSVVNATMWTPATVGCFRQHFGVHIVAIAVNDVDDYRRAACLGVDAVLADSPKKMTAIRAQLPTPVQCTDM